MPRVVVLNPSPAIDRMYFLDTVLLGQVHRAIRSTTSLGGNGINVASALTLFGAETRLVMPSDRTHEAMGWFAGNDVVQARLVPIARSIRTNTVIVDDVGTTTNINESPTKLEGAEWDEICDRALAALAEIRGHWLLITGALPIDTATQVTVEMGSLIARARMLGARVAVDTSGPALEAILRNDVPVDLVKPNLQELRHATHQSVTNLGEALAAASTLRSLGARIVLCSLGSDGVLGVDGTDPVWARSASIVVANTTGAGDAAMAGFLSGEHDGGLVAGVLRAAAWGSIVASQHNTRLLSPPSRAPDTKVLPYEASYVLKDSELPRI